MEDKNKTSTEVTGIVMSKECWRRMNLRWEMACHHVEDVRFQMERALYRKRLCEELSYAQKQLSAMEEANDAYMKEDEEFTSLKEELVEKARDLDKKLKNEEDFQNSKKPQKKVCPDLEEDLVCSICADIFVEPVLLPCGHLFCKGCVRFWSALNDRCPLCQVRHPSLKTDFPRVFILDSVVEKYLILKFTPEEAARRAKMVAERRKQNQHAVPVASSVGPSRGKWGLFNFILSFMCCGAACGIAIVNYAFGFGFFDDF